MSRFLFAVPPLAGHVNPTVAVGDELARRGHEVAWVGHRTTLTGLVQPGSVVFDAADDHLAARLEDSRTRWLQLRGAGALKFFWEEFVIPLGRAMVGPVAEAVERFSPDVVVADQQAIGAAAVARRSGAAWATSATTSGELTMPLAALPKVADWVQDCQVGFQQDLGEPDPVDLRFSDQLVVCFTTTELIGPHEPFPDHYVFTGPALTARPEVPFPWDELKPERPLVLVSLGTLNADTAQHFFRTVTDSLHDVAQLVIVAPDARLVEDPPADAIVRPFVPQLELLPRVDAVLCHGGHNTVCEALAYGVPLVVGPIPEDQPNVAQQVATAGAGLRVKFGRLRPDDLRHAVVRVLTEPSFRQNATRLARSFDRAGGAAAAAERLERLA
jgi:UDP:flavonoid glycosyltransferase YjiC (YdhE family)